MTTPATPSSGVTSPGATGWTFETLHAFTSAEIASVAQHNQVIHDAQELAIEKALVALKSEYAAISGAQEKAVILRADTMSTEFHEHLIQQRHETTMALEASDKAITKAELATEKRFEAVNEFRAQLNDQARMFMPRTESVALHDRAAERIQDLTDRLNRAEGQDKGSSATVAWLIAGLGALVSIITIVVFMANLLT